MIEENMRKIEGKEECGASRKLMTGNRAQVTIFIIVAILVVALVLIFFLWIKPEFETGDTKRVGFEGCVQDAVEQKVEELAPSAGFVDSEFNYMYMGEEIPYLCYTSEYYKTCTVQKPFLKQHFESSLEGSLRDSIDTCYENSIKNLKSEGYDVVAGKLEYEILIEPGRVRTEVDAPTSIGTARYTKFNIELNSPLYEMLMRATTIVQYESTLGDSDIDSLMGLYPEIIIDRVKRSDGTTVYEISSTSHQTKFKFASRSLAWPPGYR